MNDLIVVKQLPIIEEQLQKLSDDIDKKVKTAMSLICNEETVKEVKKVRTELSKNFKELEDQRKAVKNAIAKPYVDFEIVYNNLVGNKFKNADLTLKNKIDEVENQLKCEKVKEVKDYFEELKDDYHFDFITYEKLNLNVTLTASMKSLKEQVKAFIEKIDDDLKLIDTQEFRNEIIVEYKQSLNVSNAIMLVTERHRKLEEEKNAQAELQKVKEAEQKVIKKVEQVVQAPIIEDTKIYTITFAVKGTREQLTRVKEFLIEKGYEYEAR